MDNEKVFAMSFAKVYPMLIAKAERKGRTRAEVLEVTSWLTGYTPGQIEALLDSDNRLRRFLPQGPCPEPQPNAHQGQYLRHQGGADRRSADAEHSLPR